MSSHRDESYIIQDTCTRAVTRYLSTTFTVVDTLNSKALVVTRSDKDAILSSQDALLFSQDAILSSQDTTLSSQDATLSSQDATLSSQDARLSSQDARL
jgi:hypothetical protein